MQKAVKYSIFCIYKNDIAVSSHHLDDQSFFFFISQFIGSGYGNFNDAFKGGRRNICYAGTGEMLSQKHAEGGCNCRVFTGGSADMNSRSRRICRQKYPEVL